MKCGSGRRAAPKAPVALAQWEGAYGRSAAKDLMAAEFCLARSRGQGKFCRHQVAARRTIRIIPCVDEMGSTEKLQQIDHDDRG
jgi:hypothetical protein